jgi:hypothetical protein
VNSTPRVRGTAILGGSDRIGTEKGEEEAKIQHPHPPQITPGRPNQIEIQQGEDVPGGISQQPGADRALGWRLVELLQWTHLLL